MPRPKLPTPLVTSSTIGQVRPQGHPLPELWRIYLESADARNLSRSRLYSLRRTAELSRSLPDFPQWGEIYEWLTRLMSAGRAGTTVRLHFWDLASLFNWAIASNFSAYNPLYKKKFKVPEPPRRAIWNIHESWPLLLATAGDDARARAWLGVLRFTGLREGEALGLHASDFEFDGARWVLRVRRQRSQHTLDTTEALKTTTSRRQIEVHPSLVPLIAPVLDLAPASVRVGKGGGSRVDSPLLFPYRAADLEAMIAKLRAVLPNDFTENNAWHVFRHTCAVEWYRRGREVVQISVVLGHASIAYTQKYLRGFLGNDPTRGFFDGMDDAPSFAAGSARMRAAPVPSEARESAEGRRATQENLKLGPIGVVKPRAVSSAATAAKGGAPPGAVEKRRAGSARTPPTPQSSSNPSPVATTTEQNRTTQKRKNAL